MAESSESGLYRFGGVGNLGRRSRKATPLRLSMVRIFRHYVPVQLVMLALMEAAVFYGAIHLGAAIRLDPAGIQQIGSLAARGAIFAIVMVVSLAALGLYRRDTPEGNWAYYAKFLAAFVVGWVGMTLVFYVYPALFLGRGAFGIAFLLALSGAALLRMIFFRVVDQKALQRRVLVLGTGSRAAAVGNLLQENQTEHKFHLIGYLPLAAKSQAVDSAKVLHESDSLISIVYRHAVDEIVVGVRDRRNGGIPMAELMQCKVEGVEVTDLSTFFERETGQVQLDCLNASWLVFSDGFKHSSYKYVVKRIFDVVVSLILLVLALPIMALAALLIFLESGAPIFYRQERVGEFGRTFQILKFRSMRADAENEGAPQWARKDDDRVTSVGRVIRLLRIDELPQIFNVLRGHMSFVGPRPERPFFVKELAQKIPYYLSRHTVKPGITGWAQISFPYGASVKDAVKKLQFDLYYAKNHSLFLDVLILLQTVQVVLFGKGAR